MCFTTREYMAGKNGSGGDDDIAKIIEVFNPDDKSRSMWCLYHHTTVT
jgi:hypothetical protein